MPILSFLFSSTLLPGEPAPLFALPDENGSLVTLASFAGSKNVVLVFYPGDNTSICTRQLCAFRDEWPAVERSSTVVFGVNPQAPLKHRSFRDKFQFPFPLLVDSGQKVAKMYRCSGPIVRRTVYLIGKDGVIRFAERGNPPPARVLGAAQ